MPAAECQPASGPAHGRARVASTACAGGRDGPLSLATSPVVSNLVGSAGFSPWETGKSPHYQPNEATTTPPDL
jgi:hypothetical protein